MDGAMLNRGNDTTLELLTGMLEFIPSLVRKGYVLIDVARSNFVFFNLSVRPIRKTDQKPRSTSWTVRKKGFTVGPLWLGQFSITGFSEAVKFMNCCHRSLPSLTAWER